MNYRNIKLLIVGGGAICLSLLLCSQSLAETLKLPRIEGSNYLQDFHPINSPQPAQNFYKDESSAAEKYKSFQKYIRNRNNNRIILEEIERNWVKPENLSGHKQIALVYKLSPKKNISDIEILHSSGSIDFDKSIIDAFNKSKPIFKSINTDDTTKDTTDNRKSHKIKMVIDYTNGKLYSSTGSFMSGFNRGVGFRTEPLADITFDKYNYDDTISSFIHREWDRSNIKDFGFAVVSVDIDNYGNWSKPIIKISSGSTDFDKTALNIAQYVGNNTPIQKIHNNAHTIGIHFTNYDTSKLSEAYKSNSEKYLYTYMNSLNSHLKLYWSPSRNIIANTSKAAQIKFNVKKDGTFDDIKVYNSSGNPAFDETAVNTVKKVHHYKPLPSDYDEDKIEVIMTFEVNVFGYR